jgi:hypothetical protein
VTRDLILATVPVLLTAGLFALAAFWISRRARIHELAHRERLAMIEKGLIPPAELHPGVADFSLGQAAVPGATPLSKTASRFRSAGVMFVGIGVAVATFIGLAAGQPNIGAGIGGGIVALGAAMIINAALSAREIHAGAPPALERPPEPAVRSSPAEGVPDHRGTHGTTEAPGPRTV